MLNGLGYFPFARHYSGNHFCFLFHRVLRCFSSPGCLLASYVFRCRCYDITRSGLPHSEICGSWVISTYPQLIAGSRVLHQLLVPRHPPCALSNLTKIFMHRFLNTDKYCAQSIIRKDIFLFLGSVKLSSDLSEY